jgi:integrase
VQLSITGKGGKVRQVLLPEVVSRSLRSLRGDAGANDPVFSSRKGGSLTERAVNGMLKRAAAKAAVPTAVSPHWLRHAPRFARDRPRRITSGAAEYVGSRQHRHYERLSAARPDSSSGLKLILGCSSMTTRIEG